jgi:hypothetical protein
MELSQKVRRVVAEYAYRDPATKRREASKHTTDDVAVRLGRHQLRSEGVYCRLQQRAIVGVEAQFVDGVACRAQNDLEAPVLYGSDPGVRRVIR